MKQKLLLKTLLLLCALIAGSSSVWGDSYNYNFSSGGTNNSSANPVTNTWSTSYFTILQEKGSSSTNVANYLTSPRWYQNHTVTITPAEDITITKIVINCGGSNNGQDITPSVGSISKSGNNSTWTGSITQSAPLVLTMGTQCRPSSLDVTYSSSAALAAPTFTPGASAVAAGTTITLAQAAADAIRYTTDGTDPTKTTGTVYSTPITITTPTTIKAIAIKGDDVSSVASASYTISVTKPTISPAAGKVVKGTELTITATAGHTIRYTTDGTEPTKTTGTVYSTPIAINSPMTVKAIAVDAYENVSSISYAAYTISYPGGVDITPNYSFFGKAEAFSGTDFDEVTGTTAEGIVVTYTRNGASLYANTTSMRFYKKNTLKIDAPAGKTITNVVFTQSNDKSDDMTSTPDGYSSTTKTWSGDASSVTFTRPSTADSYLQFTNITVILANKATIAAACTDGKGMYYGTYSSGKAFKVPAELVVSEIKVVDGKLQISDYSTGDVVPANTGVMIASDASGDYTMEIATGGTSLLGAENMLHPSGDAGIDADGMSTAASGCKYYRLTMHNKTTLGFYWGATSGAAFALGANKAYLAVPDGTSAPSFFEFGGDVTGIEAMETSKTVENGEYYNLAGQRVANPTKGLYIVNGKKVVIK